MRVSQNFISLALFLVNEKGISRSLENINFILPYWLLNQTIALPAFWLQRNAFRLYQVLWDGVYFYSWFTFSLEFIFLTFVHTHPLPLFLLGKGRWSSFQIFKKGGLTISQLLQGGCWERGVTLFREGSLQFEH